MILAAALRIKIGSTDPMYDIVVYKDLTLCTDNAVLVGTSDRSRGYPRVVGCQEGPKK